MKDSDFIFGLARALGDATEYEPEDFAYKTSFNLLQGMAATAIDLITLPASPPLNFRGSDTTWRRIHQPSPTLEDDRLLDDLYVLYKQFLQRGLEDECLSLLHRVEQESASTMHPAWFDILTIPYLEDVIRLCLENELPLADSAYEESIRKTVRHYQVRMAEPRPSPLMDWSRPVPKGLCACPTCKELRQFIEDPHRRSIEFSMVFKVGQHVQRALGDDYDMVIHQTSTFRSLEVTKTSRQFGRRLHEWQASTRAVEARVKSFFERHSIASKQDVVHQERRSGLDGNEDSAGESDAADVLQARPNPPSEQPHLPVSGEKRGYNGEDVENLPPAKKKDVLT